MKKLRWKSSITVDDALHDQNPTRAPHGTPQARWSAGMPAGRRESKSVAWYRGEQAGVHGAYLTLRRAYPEAAAALIDAFGMNKDGTLGGES